VQPKCVDRSVNAVDVVMGEINKWGVGFRMKRARAKVCSGSSREEGRSSRVQVQVQVQAPV
jgi:hypothetical protein